MKYLFTTIIIAGLWVLSPIKADQIFVDKDIYKVWYDTKLEQPTKVTYEVTNRPKNADRKGMNFHKEGMFHTSDNADYYKNIWDKGHMAPAAHFSDSQENLYETFSYLNGYHPGDNQTVNIGYKAITIAGRRSFIGNISVNDEIELDYYEGFPINYLKDFHYISSLFGVRLFARPYLPISPGERCS